MSRSPLLGAPAAVSSLTGSETLTNKTLTAPAINNGTAKHDPAEGALKIMPGARPNPIGISTYSYWRYNDDSKLAIEDCIRHSAEFGFDGVEILHEQIWISWFSDVGQIEVDARLLFDTRKGRPEKTTVAFRAPPATTRGTLWGVVHDSRGGQTFLTFPVEVR